MKVKVVRNLLVLVLFTVIFSFVTVSVSAEWPVIKTEKIVSVEIRYTGSSPDFLNFAVSVHSTGNQKIILRIKDENGYELYRESIGKRDFTKLIKVFRNDHSRLQFVVDAQNSQYKKSFKIQSEILESINVTEDN